jgi:probable rRNA maturation factor
VITFRHGELLIGAGVVAENARLYGHSPSREAALCVIHGLLHLAGWDDLKPGEARKMAKKQEQIFKWACGVVESRDS